MEHRRAGTRLPYRLTAMYLTHLSLTDFRIFSRLDKEVPQKALILVGDNAQGKTSLLEAIYYLSALDSFHAGHTRELINFTAQEKDLAVSRIVGEYVKGGRSHQLEVRIIKDTNTNGQAYLRKEVLLNGRSEKITSLIGHFNAVLFLPHMLGMITGSPGERRRYLDLTISQVDPLYNQHLSEYNKAITQRNALLKQLAERGGDPDQLAYWDEKVVQSGSYLVFARIQAIRELESQAALIHQELTRGEEVLRLQYLPAFDPLPNPPGQIELPLRSSVDRSGIPIEDIKVRFREQLLETRRQEIIRGVTTIGPHRDDLAFLSNSISLGTYGSRGQIRTTLLAIKMAEIRWFKDKTGHWPVLLLDEVLAELDDSRRGDLLERLTLTQQSFLTTTDDSLFTPEFKSASQIWRIEGGRLVQS